MTFRSRRVFETTGLNVKMSCYDPGLAMPPHSHDFHQVSFLLAGGLSEAAADAGFTDQAHMTRSMKLQTGLTPNVMRGVLAAA